MAFLVTDRRTDLERFRRTFTIIAVALSADNADADDYIAEVEETPQGGGKSIVRE